MNSLQHVLRFLGFPLPVEGIAQMSHRRFTPLSMRAGAAELQPLIVQATAELVRENQLLEATSQAKTRLFAAAIHDLRQPLQGLMLFSEALSNGELDADRLKRVDQIRQSVLSLDRLLTGLLDLTQIDAGRTPPKCTDLALDPLLDEVRHHFRAVAEAQGVRLVVRPTDAWAHCDGMMLTRILNNLVCNALRHTHRGGVLVGARRHREGIRIDVCDTGVGIPQQHQSRVFEAFYKIEASGSAAHGSGLGLGLATVQRLADLQGVTVRLSSRPGRGTVMSVVLPVARTAPAPIARLNRVPGSSGR